MSEMSIENIKPLRLIVSKKTKIPEIYKSCISEIDVASFRNTLLSRIYLSASKTIGIRHGTTNNRRLYSKYPHYAE